MGNITLLLLLKLLSLLLHICLFSVSLVFLNCEFYISFICTLLFDFYKVFTLLHINLNVLRNLEQTCLLRCLLDNSRVFRTCLKTKKNVCSGL